MAHLFSNFTNAFRGASALAHRNDFAFQDPRAVQSRASALSVGSGSTYHGSIKLVDVKGVHEAARSVNDLARQQAAELGLLANPPDKLRWTTFGHSTILSDSQQGRCFWNAFPTLEPKWLDEILKRYYDADSTASSAWLNRAAELQYWDSDLTMRNMSDCKVEAMCWLLWPKIDIPNDGSVLNENYFFSQESKSGAGDWYANPPFLQNAYGVSTIMPLPPNPATASSDWGNPQQLYYNDWSATPYENPQVTAFFDIQFKHHFFMNPGDEIDFSWGIPNHQSLHPAMQVLQDPDTLTEEEKRNPFASSYALMRRCGPIVLFKFRGRLVHDETKQATAPGTGGNFGFFNVEWAHTVKFQTVKVTGGTAAYFFQQGQLYTPPALGPLYPLDDTQQWWGRVPTEDGPNA